MESFSPIRCAIYTRKSTDEGLEKEFNTLEAQREAGENYIRSMKHQGWVILPEHYDDGGFSGGSLKRPALKQLLSDVEAGKVDMIVVYKIDRLTRSLLDFAQLVKIFEKHCCSFVSVTQHFNTCDSMGKLTLNILLSFAQFERELGAERVRDKIAASKKKGMWTGGPLPLGYDSKNKKLVINKEEAEIVRFIFEDYKRTGSQFQTVRDVNEKGYKPKERMTKTGKNISKGSFNHAMISNILNNPVYLGKVVYKGELYDGQHKAIISQELWDEVKSLRKANLGEAFRPSRVIKHSLLKGLIECEYCGAMTPTRSKHGNKYYEYYTPLKTVKEGAKIAHCKVGSIPAGEIESFVIDKIKSIFQAPEFQQGLLKEFENQGHNCNAADIHKIISDILYGWVSDKPHYWCGDRNQSDIWEYNKPQHNDLHPTMKPVELVERAINNSSKVGEIVLDGFGGSGSTLIACEKTGRVARLMELDPKYCDVIVKRWEDWTGKKAVLLESGEISKNNAETSTYNA